MLGLKLIHVSKSGPRSTGWLAKKKNEKKKICDVEYKIFYTFVISFMSVLLSFLFILPFPENACDVNQANNLGTICSDEYCQWNMEYEFSKWFVDSVISGMEPNSVAPFIPALSPDWLLADPEDYHWSAVTI